MSTQEGIILILLLIAAFLFVAKKKGLNLNWSNSNRLGAMMSSSKGKSKVVKVLVTITILGLVWYFWTDITEQFKRWFGPDFPMWGYVAIIVGLIIIIGLFRMNKESREKSFHVAEWAIGLTAIGGALVIFATWQKEDALCPDKQAIISVPAQGMVVDLQSCWDESQIALDLRQTGITELAFNNETAVLKGRTIREFARIVTHTPGATDGHGMLRFNAVEMRRLGITTLPVFVGPSEHQPDAVAHFTDEQLAALAQ